MLGSIYDRINDYGSVKITLASPNDIRSWSFGEVRKPETINYRTYRPEKDGLFCERIFGPERDWECACGKYKGTKFKGIICDRCGVKVTHSRVRRKRMGHINLAAPVVHIWFFKAVPNQLGTLLAMKTAELEKIIYFQDYVVTDPGQSPLKLCQLLSEEEFREAANKYGSSFNALMGAEAIKALLARLDLEALSDELKAGIAKTGSVQKIKDLTKRLKAVNAVRNSSNKPEWMVLEVVPVIPPDLRPLVLLESGNFATSDLNDLYRRIINRNNRLKKLIDLNAPDVIIRNEKRMLQQAVDSLMDNGRCRRPVLGSNNRPLKSLTDMIKGKQGRFRENLLGKRVDYSARSVIVVGPNLKLYQCGLPKKIALELYQPFIIRKLKQHGLADTIKSAKRMIDEAKSGKRKAQDSGIPLSYASRSQFYADSPVWDILEEVIAQRPILLNRAPTLHRMGIQAFEPVLVEGNAIMLHPLACKGFNADFDGDQMAVHLPLSIEAQAETHTLMMTINNIFSPANGSPMVGPSQDMVMGNSYLTYMEERDSYMGSQMRKKVIGVHLVNRESKNKPRATLGELPVFRDTFEAIMAYEIGKIGLHEKIKVRISGKSCIVDRDSSQEPQVTNHEVIETTVGRCIFNDILPAEVPFYNMTMTVTSLSQVISDCFEFAGSAETVELLDKIKDLGFKYATLAGLSFGITDLKIPAKKQEIIDETEKRVSKIHKNYQAGVLTEGERYNQVIDAWTHARVAVTNEMMRGLGEPTEEECESHKSGAGYGFKVPAWNNGEWHENGDGYGFRVDSPNDRKELSKWKSLILHLPDLSRCVKANVDKHSFRNGTCRELIDKNIGKWLQKQGFGRWETDKPPKFLMVQLRENLFYVRPYKDDAPRQEKAIEVTAWNNGAYHESGAGYGLKVDKPADIKKFFKREWKSVILHLPYPSRCVEANIDKDSFWNDTYRELIDEKRCVEVNINEFQRIINKEIGKWLLKERFARWPKGEPPKFLMVPLRENLFYVLPLELMRYVNPIYLMSNSGARGSVDQIQQLAGMRALMAKPSGEIIETPIKSNFREGMTVLEYFSSTHGARKGLADTALKTANSGYLTRKLIDVAQNVIVTQHDCGTLQGITKSTVSAGEQISVPLSQLIIGRTARDNIRNPITDEMIVRENEVITPESAAKIEALGLDAVRVRSPLTCDSPYGICAKCYGWDMSTGSLVEEGLAVGIVAAQSIGEPGTQLTLRTFHTGGVASRAILEREQKATAAGTIRYRDINAVSFERDDGSRQIVALKRNGEMAILDDKDRELNRFKVPYGATVAVKDGQKVKAGTVLFEWDPHRTPILAEVSGLIRFVDIVEGETIRIEEERKGQVGRPVIIEHKGDKHPQIIIEETEGRILDVHYLPAGARIEVVEGQRIQAGQLLAHQPRATGGTQDITGGLPRVTEVFEARKPKDPAAMAEISGRVELRSDKRKGKMTITIRSEGGMEKEHHVPCDRHLNVHTNDMAEAGDALTDGPLVPSDILRIKGEETLQGYLIAEIQNVYRSQNVNINDKHIEIISSQMMRKVEIESVGDSSFLPSEVVDKFIFRRENERLANSIKITSVGDAPDLAEGQIIGKEELANINEKLETIGGTPAKGRKPKPATAKTLLLGITKASLRSESFIAAASFQQTTKVLTEASLAGKMDRLCGLKENVILGHLIPAGTAFKPHLEMKVKHLAEAPLPKEFAEVKEAKEVEAKVDAAVKEALGID